jgi:hypothetical protein
MPIGHGEGYVDVYVDAVLTHDKVRIHMCLTKDRYSSYESARFTIERRQTKSGKLLRLYQCPYCGGYHLTSQPEVPTPRAA